MKLVSFSKLLLAICITFFIAMVLSLDKFKTFFYLAYLFSAYSLFLLLISFLAYLIFKYRHSFSRISVITLIIIFIVGLITKFYVGFTGFRIPMLSILLGEAKYSFISQQRLMSVMLDVLTPFKHGFSLYDVFSINMVLGSLIPVLLFLVVNKLFKNRQMGFVSSLIALFNPNFFYLSRSESYTIPAIFFTLLALYLLLEFFQRHDFMFFLTAIISFGISFGMRPEYFLVFILFLSTILIYQFPLSKNKFIIAFVFSQLIIPIFSYFVKFIKLEIRDPILHGIDISKGNFFLNKIQNMFAIFTTNFVRNSYVLLSNATISLPILILGIVGSIFSLRRRNKKPSWVILIYFLSFFLFYITVHNDGFISSSYKYTTSVQVPLIIFSSYIIVVISKSILRNFKRFSRALNFIFVITLIAVFAVSYLDMGEAYSSQLGQQYFGYLEDLTVEPQSVLLTNAYINYIEYIKPFKEVLYFRTNENLGIIPPRNSYLLVSCLPSQITGMNSVSSELLIDFAKKYDYVLINEFTFDSCDEQLYYKQ